jgi:hypothetical protein
MSPDLFQQSRERRLRGPVRRPSFVDVLHGATDEGDVMGRVIDWMTAQFSLHTDKSQAPQPVNANPFAGL